MRLEQAQQTTCACVWDWAVLADVAAAVGPTLVFVGALYAAKKAWETARRDRWWARVQWALDRIHSGDEGAQRTGVAVLGALDGHAPSPQERNIAAAVNELLLAPFATMELDEADVDQIDFVLTAPDLEDGRDD